MNERYSRVVLTVGAAGLVAAIFAPVNVRAQSLSPMADTVAPVGGPEGCAGLNVATLNSNASGAAAAAQEGATASKAAIGFSVANIDKSASPCTDFFQFADGNWKKAN